MNNSTLFLSFILVVMLGSCATSEPEPVKINVDNCEYCKMTIADLHFASEFITEKGRVYKFDDLKCMVSYKNENSISNATYFVSDYSKPENLIKAVNAVFVTGEKVQSPMNGNVAAFSQKADAEKFAQEKQATVADWEQVNQ